MPTMEENKGETRPIIIFSASLAKKLDNNDIRLAPTYIGVRRVRPTSKTVRDELHSRNAKRRRTASLDGPEGSGCSQSYQTEQSNESNEGDMQEDGKVCVRPTATQRYDGIAYKVIGEDGKERRMTSKEKKEMKYKIAQEKKKARKLGIMEHSTFSGNNVDRHSDTCPDVNDCGMQTALQQDFTRDHVFLKNELAANDADTQGTSPATNPTADDLEMRQKRQYHQLPVCQEAIEEELAAFESCRVPPVMLSAAMAPHAIELLQSLSSCRDTNAVDASTATGAVIDDKLGERWAAKIREEIARAEDVRSREPIRPLAYKIVPEVWARMRPDKASHDSITPAVDFGIGGATNAEATTHMDDAVANAVSNGLETSWSFVTMRKSPTQIDDDHRIVFDQLHQLNNVHISCGAKFGSDYLLYDGPRDQRHAFAALRIIHASTAPLSARDDELGVNFPVPSPYDIAGFVRGLNTAGKLALIATVIRDDHSKPKVALVDLALEKVLSAPTHQKKRRQNAMQQRKEMGKNLSKSKS